MTFIRDHICPSETYRLNEKDLAFGELLREKPGWMQQDEYRTGRRGWIRARTALAWAMVELRSLILGGKR